MLTYLACLQTLNVIASLLACLPRLLPMASFSVPWLHKIWESAREQGYDWFSITSYIALSRAPWGEGKWAWEATVNSVTVISNAKFLRCCMCTLKGSTSLAIINTMLALTRGRLPLIAVAISSVAEEQPPPNTATTVSLTNETTPSLNRSTALVLLHCENNHK